MRLRPVRGPTVRQYLNLGLVSATLHIRDKGHLRLVAQHPLPLAIDGVADALVGVDGGVGVVAVVAGDGVVVLPLGVAVAGAGCKVFSKVIVLSA